MGIEPCGQRPKSLGGQELLAVRSVMELFDPVVTGQARRLHEEVGPLARSRLGEPVEVQAAAGAGTGHQLGDPRGRQREVALRVGRDGPQLVTPHGDPQGVDPIGTGPGQVVGRVLATSRLEQSFAELASVERLPPTFGHRSELTGDPGSQDAVTDGGPDRGQLVAAGYVADAIEREGQHRRGREPALGQADGGGEHVREGQATVAFVERAPAVDAAGHRRAADIALERHLGVALGAEPIGIGTRTGPARGVERVRRARAVVDEREQVATHATHVRRGHGQDRAGCDRGIGRGPTRAEERGARRRGEVVDRAHQPVRGVGGGPALGAQLGVHRPPNLPSPVLDGADRPRITLTGSGRARTRDFAPETISRSGHVRGTGW